jgi:hypothetical protein
MPMITSTNCLIRVGKYPCTYDISDSVFTITFPVNTEDEEDLPTKFSLSQNYPNPFNPTTKIKFSIPSVTLRQAQSDIWVTLIVYDILGNEIQTLVNEKKPPGVYEVEFDATDLASGIYLYKLRTGSFDEIKKMILLK